MVFSAMWVSSFLVAVKAATVSNGLFRQRHQNVRAKKIQFTDGIPADHRINGKHGGQAKAQNERGIV